MIMLILSYVGLEELIVKKTIPEKKKQCMHPHVMVLTSGLYRERPHAIVPHQN